jgi:LmbE family N-acetylglucosaminyl deacetylase
MTKLISASSFLLALILSSFCSLAQSIPSSEIYHHLLQLQETKRVLYVAAHPDDENTRLIATLVNGEHASVGYLSLTRGDGGQNLVGKNLGIELGQIRTQELLRARETDGGQQFFTRAMDFGYSKNPSETLQNWDKEKVLSDVVWVIRSFQPDIIITRFNTSPGGGNHGHHTTSAILANEAFKLAADPNAFPEQLSYVTIWQPRRIFWNTYNFGGDFSPDPKEKYGIFHTGEINPLLGKSYSQIAADSRTMHKSQGFGATAGIGVALDHIQLEQGPSFKTDPFEDVQNRWSEVVNGQQVEKSIEAAIQEFDFEDPSSNINSLLKIRLELSKIQSKNKWVQEKRKSLDKIIFNSLGLKMELVTMQELGYPGEKIHSTLVFNNPSRINISNASIQIYEKTFSGGPDSIVGNTPIEIPVDFQIIQDEKLSQPYWLENPVQNSIYDVRDQMMIGKPFNDLKFGGDLTFQLEGQKFKTAIPLEYKYNDQVDGEVKQPFTIVPEIDLTISDKNVFLLPGNDHEVTITVNFGGEIVDGELGFANLNASEFKIVSEGSSEMPHRKVYKVAFKLVKNEDRKIVAQYKTSSGRIYDQTTNRIIYHHIPNLTYFSPADINVIQQDWKVSKASLGYIAGVGDEVSDVLTSLGYHVTQISDTDFTLAYLSQFKTIIVGIRAYNTNETLVANQELLMDYVKAGGTVVTQYNTTASLLSKNLGPYPFSISRDRVTVENSPFKADYSSPVLSTPNQINADDFKGWIQERGLYFVTDVAKEYSQPLEFEDPNERPSKGSLIYAKYGKGVYIYTSISFFRELPAGVSGATKLFINLIEQ